MCSVRLRLCGLVRRVWVLFFGCVLFWGFGLGLALWLVVLLGCRGWGIWLCLCRIGLVRTCGRLCFVRSLRGLRILCFLGLGIWGILPMHLGPLFCSGLEVVGSWVVFWGLFGWFWLCFCFVGTMLNSMLVWVCCLVWCRILGLLVPQCCLGLWWLWCCFWVWRLLLGFVVVWWVLVWCWFVSSLWPCGDLLFRLFRVGWI